MPDTAPIHLWLVSTTLHQFTILDYSQRFVRQFVECQIYDGERIKSITHSSKCQCSDEVECNET